MKKIIVIAGLTALMFLTGYDFYHEPQEPWMRKMHATAYKLHGITYTGKHTRNGICATGRKEWLGYTAIVYQRLPNDHIGDIIGIYEIEDTGCKENVLDVWCTDIEECQEFMSAVYEDGCQGKIYVEVIRADG